MPSEVMMGLGDYRFSLPTAAYEEFQRAKDWRWPSQDRIGKAPARQFTGPGGETVELKGTIYPTFRGGLKQVGAMRAEADKGEPLLMVDGKGFVHGYWVIERIEDSPAVFFADGTPRKIDFRMMISKYNDPVGSS